MNIGKKEYDSLKEKNKKYEETLQDFAERVDELESCKPIRKKKIELILYLIFSPLLALFLIITTEYINSSIGVKAVLLWLFVSVILFIFLLPRAAIFLIILYSKNVPSVKFPKIPKSFSNKDGEIFKIEQYLSYLHLRQTHFSHDDIKFFTITTFISIFSGLLVYFVYFLPSIELSVKILFIVYLVGFFILSINLINVSLDW